MAIPGTIEEQRNEVIRVAKEWIGTPYHHAAHIKGAGVSCSWFIAAVFNEALDYKLDVIEHGEQWFLQDDILKEMNQLYLDELGRYDFIPIDEDECKTADLVVSKTSNKLYCHGGIITSWPSVIHCTGPRGVELVKSAFSSWFFGQDPRSLKFFTRKEWYEG